MMNKKITTFVVVGALALGIAVTSVFGQGNSLFGMTNDWGNQNGMMGNVTSNEDFQGNMTDENFNNSEFQGGMMGGNFNNTGFQGGMMGGNSSGGMMGSGSVWGSDFDTENSGERLTDEVLIEQVEHYLSEFDATLEAGDLFKYTNTEYYVSVENEDTGLGAFELLINPYTGSIRPEPGPNMMWNEEYSMMSGMRGSFFEGSGEMITQEEAMASANLYLQQEDSSLSVTEQGHKFSGYYTLHVEKEGKPYGMLSVHGTTGDVWYHTWHGELTEVINLHNDDH